MKRWAFLFRPEGRLSLAQYGAAGGVLGTRKVDPSPVGAAQVLLCRRLKITPTSAKAALLADPDRRLWIQYNEPTQDSAFGEACSELVEGDPYCCYSLSRGPNGFVSGHELQSCRTTRTKRSGLQPLQDATQGLD